MRFMILVKASTQSEAGVMPTPELLAAMGAFNQRLVAAGVMKDGDGLRPSVQGARVRFRGAERLVSHGPFEPVEAQVAGYWIWECASLEEAIDWVRQCPNPMPSDSDIEIRPFYEAEDFAPAKAPGTGTIPPR